MTLQHPMRGGKSSFLQKIFWEFKPRPFFYFLDSWAFLLYSERSYKNRFPDFIHMGNFSKNCLLEINPYGSHESNCHLKRHHVAHISTRLNSSCLEMLSHLDHIKKLFVILIKSM